MQDRRCTIQHRPSVNKFGLLSQGILNETVKNAQKVTFAREAFATYRFVILTRAVEPRTGYEKHSSRALLLRPRQ